MGMEYLDENGLARYDGLIKNWTTFKSGTVDGIDPLLNWQKTETAGAVTFYPLPAAPIDPTVNFLFTETGPASGEKGPDNPSTITGVSFITVTRCETEGVDSTDYTIDLGGTFYGGSVDLSTGVMTVTWTGKVFDGTEAWQSYGTVGSAYRHVVALSALGLPDPVLGINNQKSTHCTYSYTFDAVLGKFFASGQESGGGIFFSDKNAVYSTNDAWVEWVASEYAGGHPLTVVYKLATPQTVQLTPTQIYSLSQPDPYTPRINTVYSDQTSVQVGYPKSPLATASELTNAIISLGGNV